MGRKSKEEQLCVYTWLIHFAVQQKITQDYNATILQKKKKITVIIIANVAILNKVRIIKKIKSKST